MSRPKLRSAAMPEDAAVICTGVPIYLCTPSVDFRNGFDGLTGILIEDATIPIDNNDCEQLMNRPLVRR